MGFEITVDDVEQTVDELTEELDVFEFVSNSIAPTDKVTIYTNADAAIKTAKILLEEKARNEKGEKEPISIDDDYASLADEDDSTDEELNELHEQLVASGLTFHLKGLLPVEYDALEKHIRATHEYKEGQANPEYTLALNNEIVARSIEKVVSATGKTRTKPWTADEVNKFADNLYPSESNKLYTRVQILTYVSDIFDRSVSADFS